MFGFGSSVHDVRYFGLFDISSTSVGVGIVSYSKKKTELMWSKRVEFGYQGIDDYNRYVRTMYATLLEMGMKMTGEGFRYVADVQPTFTPRNMEVICLLGQPWFIGSVINEIRSKEKPFQVTSTILQELQSEALSKVISKQENISWQEVMGTQKILEVHTESIRLEGYPVTTYNRRSAQELQVQFYFGIVSETVFEHVEEVLRRVVPNHDIHFSTSTHAFSVLETLSKGTVAKRSALMEISGEITSVALLKNGELIGVGTVPAGTNHILKIIAPNALTAQEARSSLEMLYKKNSKNDFEALPEELRNALVAWKEDVVRTMCVQSEGVTPPTDIVVVAQALWYPFYKTVLEKVWDMPGVKVSLESDVRELEPKTVTKVEARKALVSVQDTRLSALTRLVSFCTQEKSMWYTKK